VVNDIEEHRLLIDGHYFWVLRLNPVDAAARGIKDGTLVRVHNDRGEVLCAAHLTHCARPGIVHSYEASARYEPVGEPGRSLDIGGAMNLLTPKESQFARSSSLGNSNCLVEVAPWTGPVSRSSQHAMPEALPWQAGGGK
jgi:anaerobic selenocysteine-containing dehydrogenase